MPMGYKSCLLKLVSYIDVSAECSVIDVVLCF